MDHSLLDLGSESDSDADWETEVLLYNLSKKKEKKSYWKSNYMKKRQGHGEFNLAYEFSYSKFTNYFRLNKHQFDAVHNIIQETIYSEGCNAQTPIGTKEKLAVFLRYLASRDSYKSIAYSYRMGDRTVSNIVHEVSKAIWENMQPVYFPQPTTEMWQK
nr:uncharacterized protein LOC111511445 [Leptinotarsa decemlineata]